MAFVKHSLVPDIIDVAPPAVLKVSYPNNVEVDEGKPLTPTQVKHQPTVSWQADSTAYYLLCMVDPVTPTLQFQHWLVGNIPGNDLSKGEVLLEYIGSGPQQGSGFHRYTFLLYKQPRKLDFTEGKAPKTSFKDARLFLIRDFAKKYNLGEPVAGNFYLAEWDEYVPILHKQLGLQ
ncbi:phosphatidylethanolamine-binding protein homolog F40A3.3-like [Agrilus planipennis]|uniref:Phosphatidylethanolamine-binding protein homolog F40A3.3-like n=1 Tax=Agrilus planipennis TaxID=224129 RepID=A0A1W4XKC5_AGRPL|nr:phosphatidylethanolamine-binding protein homolog F40A3.3-like [Agrilus planipennis]